jgi:membrane protein required for colicin V production
MLIDVIFFVLMLMALFKGVSKGLIVALFSLLAFFIGLAAALKLSAVVAVHLAESTNLTSFWLPIVSFLLVFFLVAFLVRMGAKWVQKPLNWLYGMAEQVAWRSILCHALYHHI